MTGCQSLLFCDDDHVNNTSSNELSKDMNNWNRNSKMTGVNGVQFCAENISWAIRNIPPYYRSMLELDDELLQRFLVLIHEKPDHLKLLFPERPEEADEKDFSDFDNFREFVEHQLNSCEDYDTESTRAKNQKMMAHLLGVCSFVGAILFRDLCVISSLALCFLIHMCL